MDHKNEEMPSGGLDENDDEPFYDDLIGFDDYSKGYSDSDDSNVTSESPPDCGLDLTHEMQCRWRPPSNTWNWPVDLP